MILPTKGTKSMLHPVSKLSKDGVGYVGRILSHEIHAYAFTANETYHLFNLIHKALRRICE